MFFIFLFLELFLDEHAMVLRYSLHATIHIQIQVHMQVAFLACGSYD